MLEVFKAVAIVMVLSKVINLSSKIKTIKADEANLTNINNNSNKTIQDIREVVKTPNKQW